MTVALLTNAGEKLHSALGRLELVGEKIMATSLNINENKKNTIWAFFIAKFDFRKRLRAHSTAALDSGSGEDSDSDYTEDSGEDYNLDDLEN